MNQPNDRPAGGHGGGRPGVPTGMPGTDTRGTETDRMLAAVEADLESVDEKSTQDQVSVFDRIHTALADALARTADTGGSPAAGQQGA